MADDPRDDNADDPAEELRDMLRDFLSGGGDIDPAQLANAAGLPADPELVRQLMSQLQNAMQSSVDGIDWQLALDQASTLAARSAVPATPDEVAALEQALHLAALWLGEATDIAELTV